MAADIKINVEVITKSAKVSINSLTRDLKGLQKAAQAATKSFSGTFDKIAKDADRSSKSMNKSIGIAGAAFASFAGNIAASAISATFRAITSTALDLGKQAIQTAGSFEALNTRLITLTGNTQNANKLFAELKDFSAGTPFQLDDIGNAAAQLLAFGIELDKVVPTLGNLGDVSAAAGADLGEVALIFGQVQAAGKLTGERLLQLQERAIPIGPAIAKTLGVAESEIRGLVTAGKVTTEVFNEAFQLLSQQGEFAFNGLARASLTFTGALSTTQDNLSLFLGELGGLITGADETKGALAGFSAIFQQLTQIVIDNKEEIQGFVRSIVSSIPGAIQTASNFVFGFITAFNALRTAWNLVVAGSVTLVDSILSVAETAVRAERAVKQFFGIDTSNLDAQLNALTGLRSSLEATAVEALEANKEIEDSQNRTANAVIATTDRIKNAFTSASKVTIEAAQAQRESDSKNVQSKVDSDNRIIDSEEQKNSRLLQLEQERAIAEDELRLTRGEIESEQEEERLAKLEEDLGRENAIKQLAREQNAASEQEFREIQAQGEIDAIKESTKRADKRTQYERLSAEDQKKFMLKNTSDMFGGLADLTSTGGKELFEITKALQTAQVITAGILAVQLAASAAPFPANVPGIVAETARAAASLIRINQASPRFEQGGIVPGSSFSGDNVTARVNSGEMILNRSQQSQLFNMANGGGGGGGTQEIIVNSVVELDGEVVGRSVSRQVANGLRLGEFE